MLSPRYINMALKGRLVAHACKPSTGETVVGGSWVPVQLRLPRLNSISKSQRPSLPTKYPQNQPKMCSMKTILNLIEMKIIMKLKETINILLITNILKYLQSL